MRARSWMAGGLLMLVMAVTAYVLITTGTRWFLTPVPEDTPPVIAPSGSLPPALADEMKRRERAAYLRGLTDAVDVWRLTGVVPDTPALRHALWTRQQTSRQPLTGD